MYLSLSSGPNTASSCLLRTLWQVLIISYAGGVYFNMSLDPELVDGCDELPRLFLEEIAAMAASYDIPATHADMVQQQ